MNKKIVSLLVILTLTLILQAHEFWLQPKKFQYGVGESAEIDFMVGENFVGELWDLKKHRIQKLDHYAKDYSKSLIDRTSPSTDKKLSIKLEKAGTHLFVLQSHNAFIELEAEKFNEYLKEDGLDDVIDYRTKNNAMNKSAKEHYARCAKVLVHAGNVTDDTYKKRVGLPLEIVPVNDPYVAKPGEEISFLVLYEGKPLPFTLVKVWNRKENNTIMQNIYTQKDGIITTRLSNTGTWMVSSVKMIPAKEASADWQSYWASLVFGF